MSVSREDVFRMIGFVQADMRKFVGETERNLVELRSMLAACDLPTERVELACPVEHCGITRPTQALLVEHLENVHGFLSTERGQVAS